ncbi:MAG: TolC family protein [Planctomycetota bacterium]|nr:TolC family protein [Planctomycetota bacterium]MDA1178627.1 TolC family protein [Planctomycetota bacterium]
MVPRQLCRTTALLVWLLLAGCHPTQPFYLRETGDLSKLLDVATQVEFPDVESAHDLDSSELVAPVTLTNFVDRPFWDISLEEAVAISLQNSKVIRSIGQVRQSGVLAGQAVSGTPDSLTSNADFTPTIYDPSILSTSNSGVEQALADFDARFTTSAFWEKTDRPQNFVGNQFFTRQLERDLWNFQAELTKKSAEGTQWFLRNLSTYDQNNQQLRAQASDWLTSVELEARHPFGRNGGSQFNRIPVMLARIREDISLADFETSVVNHVAQVERLYWDLYLYYRTLKANLAARDSAYRTWQKISALAEQGFLGAEAERIAQAKQQYHQFDARLKDTLRNLLITERQLRFLIGIEDSDGRMLRPADSPTEARVVFCWHDVLTEAMIRRTELRRQKWRIKEAEMQLSAAKNQLLPRLDGVALYRFLGLGDDLWQSDRNGLNFPQDDSLAWDELTEGRYAEYRFGFELETPLGYRQELAQVRSSQMGLQRARTRLEEAENEVRSQLGTAVVHLDAEFEIAQVNLASYSAANDAVNAVQSSYDRGLVPLDLLLETQQRRADAEIAFHQSLVQYNLAILEAHRNKGSLLEYNSILLAEGPWPKKAYHDALDRARQRDASVQLHPRYTRPRVVSQGVYEQHALQAEPQHRNAAPTATSDGTFFDEGEILVPQGSSAEVEESTVMDGPWGDLGLPPSRAQNDAVGAAVVSPTAHEATVSQKHAASDDPFAWGELGF